MRRTDRREFLRRVAASAVLIVCAAALVPPAPMCKAQAPKTDKTLVSWVVPAQGLVALRGGVYT